MSLEKERDSEVTAKSPTRSSQSTQHDESLAVIDKNVERRILRKLDFRVVPVLWFLFLVSFVDRSNIGNAKIAGMTKSLKMKGNQYNTAVWVFTLAYVVLAIPANILFRKVGPKVLPVMMFFWGIMVTCQGLVHNSASLIALRFLVGVFEAGFVPGCAYLIGSYYKRNEFLRRYTVFFSAAIAAGAFSGLLAFALAKMKGVGGKEGWRWIFIIEGCTTIFVSLISFFVILPFPEKNNMFTPEEKEVLFARLKADGANIEHDKIRPIEALKDWKIWVAVLIYFGAEEVASSVVAFQPSVLLGLGYTSSAAQVHTIPIYAVSFVTSLVCAWLADWLRARYIFGMFGFLVTIVGLAIEIAQPKHAGVRYAGMFFVTAGPYVIMPITVVWLAINLGKGYARSIGFGAVIGLGNCGAFVSSNVFITSEAPIYHTGFSVNMGLIMLSGICLTIMFFGLRLENRRRDQHKGEVPEKLRDVPPQDLGVKHPDFRYEL